MKLVTYNIQYSRGRDGVYNLERIAETVSGADLIALQEVERNWVRSGMADQPAELARLLPDYHWIYGAPYDLDASEIGPDGRIVRRRRQFGNMLLSRTPILTARHHLLPKYRTLRHNSLQRGALEGVIECPAVLLRIYSLHLADLIAEERLEQIAHLFALHERAPRDGWPWTGADSRRSDHWQQPGPAPEMPAEAIFMGDFNLEPGSPEYEALVGPKRADVGRMPVGHKLVDAWVATGHGEGEGITLHADPANDAPVSTRLDYCFVTPGLTSRLKACWIDEAADGSDHQPLWAELDL